MTTPISASLDLPADRVAHLADTMGLTLEEFTAFLERGICAFANVLRAIGGSVLMRL